MKSPCKKTFYMDLSIMDEQVPNSTLTRAFIFREAIIAGPRVSLDGVRPVYRTKTGRLDGYPCWQESLMVKLNRQSGQLKDQSDMLKGRTG